jgi:hypothetical protein
MWIKDKYNLLKDLFFIVFDSEFNTHMNYNHRNDSSNIIDNVENTDTAGPNGKFEKYWEYLLGDLDGII